MYKIVNLILSLFYNTGDAENIKNLLSIVFILILHLKEKFISVVLIKKKRIIKIMNECEC